MIGTPNYDSTVLAKLHLLRTPAYVRDWHNKRADDTPSFDVTQCEAIIAVLGNEVRSVWSKQCLPTGSQLADVPTRGELRKYIVVTPCRLLTASLPLDRIVTLQTC